jgi:hypothetical protein
MSEYDFVLSDWPAVVGGGSVDGIIDPAVEIDPSVVEASEALLSLRNDAIYAFDPAVFEDTEVCAHCGCVFSTVNLEYKRDYDTCATCHTGICSQCFGGVRPLVNGKHCK